MGVKKIAVALSIVVLAIIAAVFIVSAKSETKITVANPIVIASQTAAEESRGDYSPEILLPSPLPVSGARGAGTSPASQNATKAIAESIAADLLAKNKDGLVEIDAGASGLRAAAPENIVNAKLEENIGAAIERLRTVSIDDGRFLAVEPSNEAAAQYLKNAEVVVVKQFLASTDTTEETGLSADTITPDSFTPAFFRALVPRYDTAVNELYKLTVPRNLLAIHHEKIRILLLQRNAVAALLNYETDPFSAQAAGELLLDSREELASLGEAIDQFITENKIVL